jgi:hypothetical protein
MKKEKKFFYPTLDDKHALIISMSLEKKKKDQVNTYFFNNI